MILDEPFSGLDPVSLRLLRDLIVAEHRRGATILFSTHVMPQAEEICDHVVMIHRGRKVLDDPVTPFARRYDPRVIALEPLDAHADLASVRALPEVESCERVDGGYDVRLVEGTDAARAMQRITAAVAVARIELKRPSLEDVFVQLVSDETHSQESAALRAELHGTSNGSFA